MPDDDNDHIYTRRFLWLLAGVVAFRLIYLFTAVDFQIGGEEPYQWDWGRRPDWSYYSKPPLIGWLMALVRVTFGYHWWALRLTSLLLGTCSLATLFVLGRRMYDARTGFFVALMFLCTPANVLANFVLSVDGPLLLCWALSLLMFWRAVQQPHRGAFWLLLMLCMGVGTLTKQMMLVFPVLMILFAALSSQHRLLLKRPSFWLCIAGALVFLTPVIWWNIHHHGVMLSHMQEHFHHDDVNVFGWIGQVLRFPLLQAAVYSPITWVVLMAALWWCWRHWREAGDRERLLFLFSAPALLVFQVMAFRQYVNENWPAVFYISAFVFGAGHALSKPNLEMWMRRGIKLGASLLVIVYTFVPLVPVLGLVGHKKLDPMQQMRGWPEAAKIIGGMLDKVPRPEKTFVMVLDHRNNASQMAFHLPQHPTVYRWARERRVESQYEVWPDASDKIGWDCFLIYPDSADDGYKKKDPHPAFYTAFESVTKLGDADIPFGYGNQRSFQVFLCKSMKHWPKQREPDQKP